MLKAGDWLGRGSIRLKLGIAFGVILLLFAGSSLLFYSGVRDVRAARAWADHTKEVLLGIHTLSRPMVRQQAAMRGYLITYDISFLESYDEQGAEFERALVSLKGLTADNPAQQEKLERIRVLGERWEAFQNSLMELSRDTGKQAEIQAVIVAGTGTAITAELDGLLGEMELLETGLLRERETQLSTALDRSRGLSLLMLVGGIFFGLASVAFAASHVVRPLTELSALNARLSAGDSHFEVPYVARGDEIGGIARSLEQTRTGVATIASRDWIKAQLSELGAALQICRTQEEFAETLVSRLCRATGAAYGAVFCLDETEQQLVLSAGFALPENQTRSFRRGQGLVGQVGADGLPLSFSQLPAGYFAAHSGLGEALPAALVLQPLAGREGVFGVIELALFQPLGAQQAELLQGAARSAALILETLRGSLTTELLLQKTQQQKEELQASEQVLRAQEEELRASNETLREKQMQLEDQAQRLRASEEELRAQSEELRVTNVQLEEKSLELGQQKTALEQAQAALELRAVELQRASQYKSEFLANMSHELRTPLNSLLILAKGLADNEEGNLSADQIESARIVHDSGKSLLELINDILDLSKIEAGKMEAHGEDVSLDALVAATARQFRPLAQQRKLSFETGLAPGIPATVHSDGGKLGQILKNLIANALKFTEKGGVSLQVGPVSAAQATAAGIEGGEAIAFRIEDSGVGIPPDKLARLFQAFEQGDSSTSRRFGGTGLGLAISRSLSRLLGGDILAESQPGKGSAFTLVLPVRLPAAPRAQPPAPPSLPAAAAPPPEPGVETGGILIVEDDTAFASVLAGLVRAKGYSAWVAPDGETGLELARRHRPEGVLLDVGLPGLDGWQVLEALKSDPRTAAAPVHFISGADDDGRARALGAAGYLKKPASRLQIEAVLDSLGQDGTRHILLVDASAADRAAVSAMLRPEKARIDECATAAAALEKLEHGPYDLLILDLSLPDMDGFKLLETAARRGPLPPVLVNSSRDLTREESMRLREFTDAVMLKSAPSPQRLLDEASLFLHSLRPVPARTAAPQADTLPELFGKTVLIVDDDMRNIFALSKALRGRGLKVMMAQDGPKALAQLENSPEIALVLMDIMMPGMDGYEATRQIRARPAGRNLPVIAVTAKAMVGDREKCLAAGATDYCTKPIDVDQLVEMMRRYI